MLHTIFDILLFTILVTSICVLVISLIVLGYLKLMISLLKEGRAYRYFLKKGKNLETKITENKLYKVTNDKELLEKLLKEIEEGKKDINIPILNEDKKEKFIKFNNDNNINIVYCDTDENEFVGLQIRKIYKVEKIGVELTHKVEGNYCYELRLNKNIF